MNPTFFVQTAKIVGTPAEGFWSQLHTFFPQDEEKKQKRGDLLVVLVLKGTTEGVEAITVGREVLSRLHEEFYGNLEGSAFERLRLSVEKVCLENKGAEIVASCLSGAVLYLAISGKGKVLLKRGDKIGIVLQGKETLTTASGILNEGDIFFLGSQSFFDVVGDGVLNAALSSGLPSDAVEILAPIVLGHQGAGGAAAVLALIKKDEDLGKILSATK